MPEPLRVVDPETGELVIPGCKSCHELAARVAGLEGDMGALQRENLRLLRSIDTMKRNREAERQRSKQRVVIERLHELWQSETGKTRSPLGPKRFDALERALKHYTPEQIELAIVGAAAFPFYVNYERSRTGTGKRHTGIEHICEKEDRFELLAVLGAGERRRRTEEAS